MPNSLESHQGRKKKKKKNKKRSLESEFQRSVADWNWLPIGGGAKEEPADVEISRKARLALDLTRDEEGKRHLI